MFPHFRVEPFRESGDAHASLQCGSVAVWQSGGVEDWVCVDAGVTGRRNSGERHACVPFVDF